MQAVDRKCALNRDDAIEPFELKRRQPAKFSCGDLFAGAGGLAVGFHAAGFGCVFFNEIDEQAAATFEANFHGAQPFVCPIQELTAARIRRQCGIHSRELDVVVGGPPCQGFSIYAPKRSKDDARNHLFRHYVRLVLEGIKPKFIVMENVPGLVSLDGGATLKSVVTAFEQAGYRVIYKILNAAHYGVPEERWRLFFLGTRLPRASLTFPEPRHFSLRRVNFTGGRELTFAFAVGAPDNAFLFPSGLIPPTTVSDAISDLPAIESNGGAEATEYRLPPETKYQAAMRRDSHQLMNHQCNGVQPINMERMKYVSPGGSWREIPFDLLPAGLKRARRSDHTRRYGRIHPNEPSGTILTRCDPHWGSYFHYSQDRIISIREAARIQSFPDWFRFTGPCTEQYKQVGNAVPPLLAKALAVHISHELETSGQ